MNRAAGTPAITRVSHAHRELPWRATAWRAARWAIAGAVLLASACSEPDPEAEKLSEIARRSNVIVRAELAGQTLTELEQRVAIPIERALGNVPHVTAIDTTIRGSRVEIVLVVVEGNDARVIERDITHRLLTAVVPPATRTTTVLASTWSSVIRLTSSSDRPETVVDAPGVSRLRTCGPDMVHEVVLDPAKLAAYKLAIDDVFVALESSSAEAALLPGDVRIDAVATIGEVDRSPCRVSGGEHRHVGSIHHESVEFWKTLERLRAAGWSLLPMLGGHCELVFGFDGVEVSSADAIARVTDRLRGQPGIEIGFAMEELGPPHVGRIIFRPAYDAKPRDAAKAAVAGVRGVRLLEIIETGMVGTREATATLTGDDRDALMTQARAALPALEAIDPEGGTGCVGCDRRAVLELRAGEAMTANTARIVKLVGDGVDVTTKSGIVRVRIAMGAELAPEVLAGLLVRTNTGGTAPLSSVAEIRTVPRPSVLLRRDGKPAVRVWKHPITITIGEATMDLQQAFPAAVVAEGFPELW
jgi:hypothetical protein